MSITRGEAERAESAAMPSANFRNQGRPLHELPDAALAGLAGVLTAATAGAVGVLFTGLTRR